MGVLGGFPSVDPLFHSPAPKRRGRPPGAKSQVIKDPRSLGLHHFAFVRSALLGLDLRQSFDRYLAWAESTTDLRYVQNRKDSLLQQIIDAARNLDPSTPQHVGLEASLDLLRSQAKPVAALQLPTLEEWLDQEGMDPDMYSEAELLDEYKAAFGLDNADALEAGAHLKDPSAERVRALNHLESLLAIQPTAEDKLELWFARPVVKRLRNAGLLYLKDLVNFINVYGYRWHGRIAGFGALRAGQVLHWLQLQQEQLHMAIQASARQPKALASLYAPQPTHPTPSPLLGAPSPALPSPSAQGSGGLSVIDRELQRIALTPALTGESGVFRSHMANTLGANNDWEAINAWLSRYHEKPSTQRSYRKEVERFVLWSTQVLRKPLSSVTAPDCQRYREFLKAVPQDWIHALPVPRTDPQWRAFRGQPSPASQKQALVILQTLFTGLVDAGYLVANPFRALMKSFDLPVSKVDIRRSFTQAEWSFIQQNLSALPSSPETRRLRCILELLVTSGVRLDELATARYQNLRLESLPDLPPTWVLTVTGKRKKTREIPLLDSVVRLITEHGKEFMEADKQLTDAGELPLIRTLHASVPQWRQVNHASPEVASITVGPGMPLSASGIYAVLKRFFTKISVHCEEHGLEQARFLRASTHWMRHTFVRQALVDGIPIEVVSELAGHASIDTTSIYSTQELARKIHFSSLLTRKRSLT